MRIKLQHVAHVRSGDKGNTSNIAVIAYAADLYAILKEQLSAGRLKEFYHGVVNGQALRRRQDRCAQLRGARCSGRRCLAQPVPRQLGKSSVLGHPGV
jgi:hypothetical protein